MFEINFNIFLSSSKLAVNKSGKFPHITLLCRPRQRFLSTSRAKFYATITASVLNNKSYFIAKKKHAVLKNHFKNKNEIMRKL